MKNKFSCRKWREVSAFLILQILFCFASCNLTITSENDDPEVVASYDLKGDEIYLYDDNTFAINLKDNAGTISGTYTSASDGYKLTVVKASGDTANPDDIFKLKVNEREISVGYSDIGRYSTGDTGEQTGGTSLTTPDNNKGSADSDHSLGNASEGNRLSEKYFNVIDCADGILFECTVLAGSQHFRVNIDGIGQVAQTIWLNDKRNKGSFFYPFLDPGKEYTIRFTFLREEDIDDNGFSIGYVGDGTIAWFETKVKAGANSKGEVRLTDFGKIKVESNGDFMFTEKPKFENENLLTGIDYDWMVNIGLVEGVSWEHPNRRTKWSGEITIPHTSITEKHNFYTECDWKNDNLSIDFIHPSPILYYEYGGKIYSYRWDGNVVDTPELKSEAELYTSIDINNPTDVAKIQGTWTNKWEGDTNNVHIVYEKTLEIGDTVVKHYEFSKYTKPNGTAFANDELLDNKWEWCYTDEVNFLSTDAETFDEYLKNNPNIFDFERIADNTYKIWKIHDNHIRSDDGKTITWINNYEMPLCEYFKYHTDINNKTVHYDDLALFEDGTTLRTITSGKEHDMKYTDRTEYKKQ